MRIIFVKLSAKMINSIGKKRYFNLSFLYFIFVSEFETVFNLNPIQNPLCITNSGFCFYTQYKFQIQNVLINDDWLYFTKSTIETLDDNSIKTGKGYIDSVSGAGGRIVIGVDYLKLIGNSLITSNSSVFNKKKFQSQKSSNIDGILNFF